MEAEQARVARLGLRNPYLTLCCLHRPRYAALLLHCIHTASALTLRDGWLSNRILFTLADAGESQLVPRHPPHNPRRFTHRECARLMGFPDWYALEPSPADRPFCESAGKKRKLIECASDRTTAADVRSSTSGVGEGGWFNAVYQMIGNAVCPPLVAALAGAVLAHSIPFDNCSLAHRFGGQGSWEAIGRAAAVQLATGSAIVRNRRN